MTNYEEVFFCLAIKFYCSNLQLEKFWGMMRFLPAAILFIARQHQQSFCRKIDDLKINAVYQQNIFTVQVTLYTNLIVE